MISREICQRVLRKAVSTGADYAELFAENTVNHSIHMVTNAVDAIKDAVIAGVSFQRAIQLKRQIADEEALTSNIINWFITTYDKKQLDDCIMAMDDEIESEEVLDLRRYDIISSYLTRENDHLDKSYVAKLTEDIYTLIYES